MASQFVLRCDGSGIETVARQFAVISCRGDDGISRRRRKGNIEHPTSNAERRTSKVCSVKYGGGKVVP
jgi:hypothetical protein